MGATYVTPAFWRQKLEAHKLQASLGYIVNSRSALTLISVTEGGKKKKRKRNA